MKKIYMSLMALVACALLLSTQVNAQEFEWPDLGEAMIIEPGPPGTINETINGDTTATGERAHQSYILKRGALYLYTAAINNVGWDLMVQAEEGDGALPVIKALGPPEGSDEAPRPFTAQGNIYLKGLNMSGWDQLDFPTDNATVRLNADDIKGVVIGCILDFNRQNSFRTNNPGTMFFLEDNIIYGQGRAEQMQNGSALNARGNFSPIVIYRNNTMVNLTNTIVENRQTKRYGKWVFDHNTIVNIGRMGSDWGRPDSLIFTNNLVVNPMILGDGVVGDRDNFAEPWFAFNLDSNFVEQIVGADTSMVFAPPYVEYDNNWHYIDPAVAAFLPDSSNPASADNLYDEQLADIVAASTNTMIINEAFAFTSFPNQAANYEAYINDYYTVAEQPAQLPGFDLDPSSEIDFGYSSSHAAYTAAADGTPLGDPNWHDIGSGVRDMMKQVNMRVYPNPVGLYFIIDAGQEIDRVEILNLLGQPVKDLKVNARGQEVLVNSSDLSEGLYFVRCSYKNRIIGNYKITK